MSKEDGKAQSRGVERSGRVERRTRTFEIKSPYYFRRGGYVTKWRFLTECNPVLFFGGIYCPCSSYKDGKQEYDFKVIRETIRHIEVPQTREETTLLSLENLFFSSQIFCFHSSLSDEEAFSCVSLGDMPAANLEFTEEKDVTVVEVEETYFFEPPVEQGKKGELFTSNFQIGETNN